MNGPRSLRLPVHGHDHTGRAEATLGTMHLGQSVLDTAQAFFGRAQALDGVDAPAIAYHERC